MQKIDGAPKNVNKVIDLCIEEGKKAAKETIESFMKNNQNNEKNQSGKWIDNSDYLEFNNLLVNNELVAGSIDVNSNIVTPTIRITNDGSAYNFEVDNVLTTDTLRANLIQGSHNYSEIFNKLAKGNAGNLIVSVSSQNVIDKLGNPVIVDKFDLNDTSWKNDYDTISSLLTNVNSLNTANYEKNTSINNHISLKRINNVENDINKKMKTNDKGLFNQIQENNAIYITTGGEVNQSSNCCPVDNEPYTPSSIVIEEGNFGELKSFLSQSSYTYTNQLIADYLIVGNCHNPVMVGTENELLIPGNLMLENEETTINSNLTINQHTTINGDCVLNGNTTFNGNTSFKNLKIDGVLQFDESQNLTNINSADITHLNFDKIQTNNELYSFDSTGNLTINNLQGDNLNVTCVNTDFINATKGGDISLNNITVDTITITNELNYPSSINCDDVNFTDVSANNIDANIINGNITSINGNIQNLTSKNIYANSINSFREMQSVNCNGTEVEVDLCDAYVYRNRTGIWGYDGRVNYSLSGSFTMCIPPPPTINTDSIDVSERLTANRLHSTLSTSEYATTDHLTTYEVVFPALEVFNPTMVSEGAPLERWFDARINSEELCLDFGNITYCSNALTVCGSIWGNTINAIDTINTGDISGNNFFINTDQANFGVDSIFSKNVETNGNLCLNSVSPHIFIGNTDLPSSQNAIKLTTNSIDFLGGNVFLGTSKAILPSETIINGCLTIYNENETLKLNPNTISMHSATFLSANITNMVVDKISNMSSTSNTAPGLTEHVTFMDNTNVLDDTSTMFKDIIEANFNVKTGNLEINLSKMKLRSKLMSLSQVDSTDLNTRILTFFDHLRDFFTAGFQYTIDIMTNDNTCMCISFVPFGLIPDFGDFQTAYIHYGSGYSVNINCICLLIPIGVSAVNAALNNLNFDNNFVINNITQNAGSGSLEIDTTDLFSVCSGNISFKNSTNTAMTITDGNVTIFGDLSVVGSSTTYVNKTQLHTGLRVEASDVQAMSTPLIVVKNDSDDTNPILSVSGSFNAPDITIGNVSNFSFPSSCQFTNGSTCITGGSISTQSITATDIMGCGGCLTNMSKVNGTSLTFESGNITNNLNVMGNISGHKLSFNNELIGYTSGISNTVTSFFMSNSSITQFKNELLLYNDNPTNHTILRVANDNLIYKTAETFLVTSNGALSCNDISCSKVNASGEIKTTSSDGFKIDIGHNSVRLKSDSLSIPNIDFNLASNLTYGSFIAFSKDNGNFTLGDGCIGNLGLNNLTANAICVNDILTTPGNITTGNLSISNEISGSCNSISFPTLGLSLNNEHQDRFKLECGEKQFTINEDKLSFNGNVVDFMNANLTTANLCVTGNASFKYVDISYANICVLNAKTETVTGMTFKVNDTVCIGQGQEITIDSTTGIEVTTGSLTLSDGVNFNLSNLVQGNQTNIISSTNLNTSVETNFISDSVIISNPQFNIPWRTEDDFDSNFTTFTPFNIPYSNSPNNIQLNVHSAVIRSINNVELVPIFLYDNDGNILDYSFDATIDLNTDAEIPSANLFGLTTWGNLTLNKMPTINGGFLDTQCKLDCNLDSCFNESVLVGGSLSTCGNVTILNANNDFPSKSNKKFECRINTEIRCQDTNINSGNITLNGDKVRIGVSNSWSAGPTSDLDLSFEIDNNSNMFTFNSNVCGDLLTLDTENGFILKPQGEATQGMLTFTNDNLEICGPSPTLTIKDSLHNQLSIGDSSISSSGFTLTATDLSMCNINLNQNGFMVGDLIDVDCLSATFTFNNGSLTFNGNTLIHNSFTLDENLLQFDDITLDMSGIKGNNFCFTSTDIINDNLNISGTTFELGLLEDESVKLTDSQIMLISGNNTLLLTNDTLCPEILRYTNESNDDELVLGLDGLSLNNTESGFGFQLNGNCISITNSNSTDDYKINLPPSSITSGDVQLDFTEGSNILTNSAIFYTIPNELMVSDPEEEGSVMYSPNTIIFDTAHMHTYSINMTPGMIGKFTQSVIRIEVDLNCLQEDIATPMNLQIKLLESHKNSEGFYSTTNWCNTIQGIKKSCPPVVFHYTTLITPSVCDYKLCFEITYEDNQNMEIAPSIGKIPIVVETLPGTLELEC